MTERTERPSGLEAVRPVQPLLHDLVATVAAPSSALSGRDGQIRGSGVQGVFHTDVRVLSAAILRVDGHEPDGIGYATEGSGVARFVGLARHLGDDTPDPTVRVDRVRRVSPDGMAEDIRLASTATAPVFGTVTVDLACDLAPIEQVKSGGVCQDREPVRTSGALTWPTDTGEVTVAGEDAWLDPDLPRLVWQVALAPGEQVVLRWRLTVRHANAIVRAPDGPVEWQRPEVRADDQRLVRLLDRALDDLSSLRLTEQSAPGDTFLGAGVPWFLTLFGRDSIWAARMMLPLGTELAAGTLRTLARRQGTRVDPETGEAPGKIMHELRGHPFVVPGQGPCLPATYYGTADATPLWISLLHDAWRWGMPAGQVAELLPKLEAALGWLAGHADPDGDGFLEYIDQTGRGLANQGWKDSGDSVRYHNGLIAPPPIALCEVQGYAYAAALQGANLLDAFGRAGGDRWREYAEAMAARFQERFWIPGADGGYPALALDRDKRPVDSLTSNIGHLLGTGLLTADQSRIVAARLVAPDMASGYGLRTMSILDSGYAPLSYHCGSVWPHDTAIVLSGLVRDGFGAEAAVLAEGLLAAAEEFEYRLPEVYSGDARDEISRPIPYPAACRPQAWSAAAAVAVLTALLGVEADVPAGELRVTPPAGTPLGAIAVRGLRLAGQPFEVVLERGAPPAVSGLPEGIRLTIAPPVPVAPRQRQPEQPTAPRP
jgi:glycogen debranching enzyme